MMHYGLIVKLAGHYDSAVLFSGIFKTLISATCVWLECSHLSLYAGNRVTWATWNSLIIPSYKGPQGRSTSKELSPCCMVYNKILRATAAVSIGAAHIVHAHERILLKATKTLFLAFFFYKI